MIDGTEYGPRLGEIGNWVGKAVYCPRAFVNKIISRSEFDNPGVYCLKGDPTSDSFEERIYIGEAENIRSRIKQHLNNADKDFNELIFFISKDELLTKTQIKFLEAKLIQIALEAKTAEIENGNYPSLPTLHEADISDMDFFLEQMKLILPVMGFRFLISSTLKYKSNEEKLLANEPLTEFIIKSKSLTAKMYESDQGYIVKKGSQAKISTAASITSTYRNLIKKLKDTGLLVENNGFFEFTDDTIFSSPSAASSVVLGRNSNGFSEWVLPSGKTFKEAQQINTDENN